VRPLVSLELVERMRSDVASATGEREDAAERSEDPLDRPWRKTVRLQLAHHCDDIVGRDQRETATTKARQKVTAHLRAVEIERPVAPMIGSYLGFEIGEPAGRDLGKGQSR
jgi:hypothetical protein